MDKDYIFKNYKPSAYRSMILSKYGFSKPITKSNKGALKRWSDEEWINLNALLHLNKIMPCGKKYKGQIDKTVCRPMYKINDKTPKPLALELSKKDIEDAIKRKNKGERINWVKYIK